MSSAVLDAELLSAPLPGDLPCGVSLDDDPAWLEMELAAAGTPESQYGEHITAAKPPNWLIVHQRALDLASRSRDLRLAVWLTRSGAHTQGLPGFGAGLVLIDQLLARHWETVHPQLDPGEGNDPAYRMITLGQLAATEAGIADLRSATLAPARGSLTVRSIELACRAATAYPNEVTPTEEGVTQGLKQLLVEYPDLASQAQDAAQLAHGLVERLAGRVGANNLPELSPMLKLLDLVSQTVAAAAGNSTGANAAQGAAAAVSSLANPAQAALAGPISSRADAARLLTLVCDWLERNEPSNPAPLLIRRAQRVMDKSFLEIIRDLSPEGLNQVQLIAGTEAKP